MKNHSHQMRPADEDHKTIVEETYAQPVANQAGWHGVEDLAQGEATGARHGDSHLLKVRGAALGKLLQMRALGVDALAERGIAAADDLIDESAIGAEIACFSNYGTAISVIRGQ
jgi:hypothetical protein